MFSRELRENCTKAGTQLLHLEYHDLNDVLLSQTYYRHSEPKRSDRRGICFSPARAVQPLAMTSSEPDSRNYFTIVIPSRSAAIGEESAFACLRGAAFWNDVLLRQTSEITLILSFRAEA